MNHAPSPETLAAQAMGDADATSGTLATAIHPSTTYERSPDGTYPSGLVYTRADNPTYACSRRRVARASQAIARPGMAETEFHGTHAKTGRVVTACGPEVVRFDGDKIRELRDYYRR